MKNQSNNKTGGKNVDNESGDIEKTLTTISEVRGLIYRIRGRDVMLDADLAKLYGYTTKAFNQQVKNNLEKFEGEDFMFQLSKDEYEDLMCKNYTSRSNYIIANENLKCQNNILSIEYDSTNLKSQIVTSNHTGINSDTSLKSKILTSSWGGVRKLPYAFTEQGVYMLMTVLRGELAVKQSRALVMTFKAMKDYVIETKTLVSEREDLKMLEMVAENSQQVGRIKERITIMDKRLIDMESKVENAVMRNEVSPVMLDFNKFTESREYLFMENELMEARDVYLDIYSKAKKSIHIIDNYIDIRTLRLLGTVRKGVKVTIFSDNKGHHLHLSDLIDFRHEFPSVEIELIQTCDTMHDRFIIVDYGEKGETTYHCGGSSKDAGRAVTMISKVDGKLAVESMEMIVGMLMGNPKLELW